MNLNILIGFPISFDELFAPASSVVDEEKGRARDLKQLKFSPDRRKERAQPNTSINEGRIFFEQFRVTKIQISDSNEQN